MKPRALGGERTLRKPYAVRVDIPRYSATQIIADAKNPASSWALRELANVLEGQLKPWYPANG